ncbi:hypothetical protein KGY73_09700 [bacterium]|nr:hypothetical protein [bacterium]
MKNKRGLNLLILTAAVTALFGACVEVGELEEKVHSIPLDGVESLKVELDMGAGKLNLHGGTIDLMEGSFVYNVEEWKPEIDYYVSEGKGLLEIEQGRHPGIPMGDSENEWNISLNDRIPMDVKLDLGAGETNLDFQGLLLNSLVVDMGVGELTLDLSGERTQSVDVNIQGGIGSATIYLPEKVGVRVNVEKGIGSVDSNGLHKEGHIYTNDSFGKTKVSVEVNIEAGIGSVDLRLK